MTIDADFVWEPFCGVEYPQEKIAGDPIICDRDPHSEETKHLNSELGFEWW